MAYSDVPLDLLSATSLLLLLLMETHQRLLDSALPEIAAQVPPDFTVVNSFTNFAADNVEDLSMVALHHFRIWSTMNFLDEDMGYWVKPRSTTWFSRFLIEEYDDDRWIEMFRFTKREIFNLASLLSPTLRKQDTKYRYAIPVVIRLACTLFKLSHAATFLICSELFAVGRSTVSVMLREVVTAINIGLRNEIMWPSGDAVSTVASEFQQLCGLPGVVGAIDGTHIAISKPKYCPIDYYYFKSGGYSINCQAVVDNSRRFMDLYVGMPSSTNDSRMLRRSMLFYRGEHGTLWEHGLSFHGFSPSLLGDGGYPLLPWLMVPHRQHGALSVADRMFNRKLSRGRSVVENAFGIMKLTFRELEGKTDLDVAIVPDVVMCCAILHNVLLNQSEEAIERLLGVIRAGPQHEENLPQATVAEVPDEDPTEDVDIEAGVSKRNDLGVFLTLQRIIPPTDA